MDRQLDCLLIHSGSSPIYQGLKAKFSAVEPPTWCLLLANSVRASGYGAAIIDQDADCLTDSQVVEKTRDYNPRLTVFVVYGSEPNQSTTRMATAAPLAKLLRERYPEYKTCFVGGHVAAEPMEVLNLPGVDFVLLNEGVYALQALLATDLNANRGSVASVRGIGSKFFGGAYGLHEQPEQIVPQEAMDRDLPGHAWDLIDLKKYRSHFWFGGYDQEKRSPYAAIYTSLGCPYRCHFCCIQAPFKSGAPSDANTFRYWSTKHTLNEIKRLVENGVKNIRISDEMFFLKPGHYAPLVNGLQKEYGDSLNLWAYARVDTVRPNLLKYFREAGFRWLCLGIESGNRTVRREAAKGSYEDVDVKQVVKECHEVGIEVIANYIFGLPTDTLETMEETYQLSEELDTAMWNAYPSMALPGSTLYTEAKAAGRLENDSYESYGFLSYECRPLPTEKLSGADIVRFRDEAFRRYWSRPEFQAKIEKKFGVAAANNIRGMLGVRLRRKVLGDAPPES